MFITVIIIYSYHPENSSPSFEKLGFIFLGFVVAHYKYTYNAIFPRESRRDSDLVFSCSGPRDVIYMASPNKVFWGYILKDQ